MLAHITLYIELWIKEDAQKYAERVKSLYTSIQKWNGNHEEL